MKPTNDVVARINKALLFIDANLSKKLVLERVAQEASFSAYHFHRLFSVVVGETLNAYILRKRIEKSAKLLLRKENRFVADIAFEVGFESASSFSRSFKKFYGVSPSEFKENTPSKFSKIRIAESKNGKPVAIIEQYISNINNYLEFITMNATIEVKDIAGINVAYMSHIGPMEGIAKVYDDLIKWAFPLGLMTNDVKMATIYHDSPKVTEPDKIRMSACILLKESIKVSEGVGLRTIPEGKHVVASFEIRIEDFQKAWESVFVWLSEKGFKVRGVEPFEVYHNDFKTHPENKCIVDFYVPVE